MTARAKRSGVASWRRRVGAATLILLGAVLVYNALFNNMLLTLGFSNGTNYRNVSVDARVNITNAGPIITSVRLPASITLVAGSFTTVQCNVSVRDYNGFDDINRSNATFYHSTSSAGAADDNNTHYTNSSCVVASEGGEYRNYSCNFSVLYYALNGSWTCNATAIDNSSFVANNSNTTTINSMLALNVTPLVDYGNMAVGDTSENKTANVTNIGNLPINVSVKGYGQNPNDGLAFVCQVGNISLANEKWSVNVTDDYSAKNPLTSNFVNMSLNVPKQTDAALKQNTTYWQVYVPPNPFGQCNGTIVFQAESA